MTSLDPQRYASIAGVAKSDFSYSCAAVDKISTDKTQCTISLRHLSFLYSAGVEK